MRSHIVKLIILLLVTILWVGSASSMTADGLSSPNNIIVDGGGQAAIAAAIDQAQPGDTIVVKAGNYDNNDPQDELDIKASGTAGAPITLRGENRPRLGTVEISDSSHLVIEGFEIADQTSNNFFTGFDIDDSHHITIRDMLIHDLTGSAMSAGGDSSDILIENSTIHDVVSAESDTDAHCFVNSTAKNVTFRNNVCYGFIGDGYHAWKAGAELRDRGTTLIEGNTIFNTRGPCTENGLDIKAEAGTLVIRDNVFYGFREMQESQCAVHASGCGYCQAINIQDGGTGDLLIENNEIFDSDNGIFNSAMKATIQNNIIRDINGSVFYDKGTSSKYYHNTIVNSEEVFHDKSNSPQEVANNLFYDGGDTIGGTYHYNGWFGNNQTRPGSGDVTGGDPHLNSDYSLAPDSPLIDRGMNLGIDSDFTGVLGLRPQGLAPDIGAFEFAGSSPPPTPTATATPAPNLATLVFNGPDAVAPGQTFALSVEAQDLTEAGLYGVQLEINYDPNLISAANLQVNPDLSFVLRSNADNTAGKISLIASREGDAPGLTGDVTLLTFEARAAATSGSAALTLENVKISDPQAAALEAQTQDHNVTIGDEPTPEPTDEPTPEPTDEPTPEPTDEPTPEPTDEPTPEPTDEPTPEPTGEPTPEPTGEPTPEPTDEPTTATVSGQVILAGRVDNNWSEATVVLEGSASLTAVTDAGGNFTVAEAAVGTHTSITAAAAGYLSAVCTEPTVAVPETSLLPVTLLSGDIVADHVVDITDATAVGVSFDQSGADLPADINRDGFVDIFDLVLVTINFGKSGPQTWNCQTQ